MAILYASLLVLGANIVLASTPASNALCKGGLPAWIASDLSGFPQAQSFCSSKFPVPATTITLTAPATEVHGPYHETAPEIAF